MHNDKRYRLFNGSKINCNIYPNSYPLNKRIAIAITLASEVYNFLCSGKCITQFQKSKLIKSNMTDMDYLDVALEKKLKENHSDKYKSMLRFVHIGLSKVVVNQNITLQDINKMLFKYSSGVSFNTVKRHLNVLLNEVVRFGMEANPMIEIKSKKTKARLHKPFIMSMKYLHQLKHTTNSYIYVV